VDSNSFWIGLTDIEVEGTFRWQDGTLPNYTNWNPLEPNNEGGNEDCGQIWGIRGRQWNDEFCGFSYFFICEVPYVIDVINRGSYAFEFHRTQRNYTDAQGICAARGGSLAKIRNQQDQDAINNYTPMDGNDFWIGLNDIAVEGTFRWQDGTLPSYTNWYPGEPNQRNNEDCVQIWGSRGRQWNDGHCYQSIYFICEVPATA